MLVTLRRVSKDVQDEDAEGSLGWEEVGLFSLLWGYFMKVGACGKDFSIIKVSLPPEAASAGLTCPEFVYPQRIPLNIFQVHESHDVSPEMRDAQMSFVELNPEYTYRMFDLAEARLFVKDTFPAVVLEAYDSLVPISFKTDLWRYCVLYHYGGVYFDSKVVLCRAFRQFFPADADVVLCRDRQDTMLLTYLASTPRNEFLEMLVGRCTERVLRRCPGPSHLHVTGPGFLGEVFREFCGLGDGSIRLGRYEARGLKLDVALVHPPFCDNLIVDQSLEVVAYKSYRGYYRKDRREDYKKMWLEGNIFFS